MKCSPKNLSGSSGRKPMFSANPPRVRKCVVVTQACCAFQTIGGIVQMMKIPSSQYNPGRLNSWRRRGANASTSKMQMISNAFVNRERNPRRSEEHTSELQSRQYLVCRLLLEKKKKKK